MPVWYQLIFQFFENGLFEKGVSRRKLSVEKLYFEIVQFDTALPNALCPSCVQAVYGLLIC